MPPPSMQVAPLLVTETLFSVRLPLLLIAPPDALRPLQWLPVRVRLLSVTAVPTAVDIAPAPRRLPAFWMFNPVMTTGEGVTTRSTPIAALVPSIVAFPGAVG